MTVTLAARGMSRQAAEAILAGCPDVEDRYADHIALAGGHAQWIDQLDADPRNWAHRLEMARVEVEGMLPYWNQAGPP